MSGESTEKQTSSDALVAENEQLKDEIEKLKAEEWQLRQPLKIRFSLTVEDTLAKQWTKFSRLTSLKHLCLRAGFDTERLGGTLVIGGTSSLNETEQFSSTYDAVGKRIEFLKKAVVTCLNDLRNKTILNLIFVGTTVVLFVAALLWSNLIGLIAAAGLEGTNLYIQGKSWQDTITVYWKDRTKIKIALNEIEGKYASCKENDANGLKEVQDLITALYGELKSASLS